MVHIPACISINEIAETIGGLLDALIGFCKLTEARVKEWEGKGGGDGLAAELAAVVSEADSLSRLITSIIDDTEEQIPTSELQCQFNNLQRKTNMLLARWQSKQANCIER